MRLGQIVRQGETSPFYLQPYYDETRHHVIHGGRRSGKKIKQFILLRVIRTLRQYYAARFALRLLNQMPPGEFRSTYTRRAFGNMNRIRAQLQREGVKL